MTCTAYRNLKHYIIGTFVFNNDWDSVTDGGLKVAEGIPPTSTKLEKRERTSGPNAACLVNYNIPHKRRGIVDLHVVVCNII